MSRLGMEMALGVLVMSLVIGTGYPKPVAERKRFILVHSSEVSVCGRWLKHRDDMAKGPGQESRSFIQISEREPCRAFNDTVCCGPVAQAHHHGVRRKAAPESGFPSFTECDRRTTSS